MRGPTRLRPVSPDKAAMTALASLRSERDRLLAENEALRAELDAARAERDRARADFRALAERVREIHGDPG